MNVDDDGVKSSSTNALWAYDTTDSTFNPITSTRSGSYDDVRDLIVIDSVLYFTAESDAPGGSTVRQLYSSNGSLSGLSLASDGLIFGTYESNQVLIELGNSLVTWAFTGDSTGREIVHDQSVITTITYSY